MHASMLTCMYICVYIMYYNMHIMYTLRTPTHQYWWKFPYFQSFSSRPVLFTLATVPARIKEKEKEEKEEQETIGGMEKRRRGERGKEGQQDGWM